MQVQDIMTKDVSCCSPATNAAAAAEMMWKRNCGVLPVIEDGGRLVGMVTDRDLFIALGTQNRRPADLPVGEIMNTEVALCAAADDLGTALKLMAAKQVQRLPVVGESHALEGMLSIDDVLRAPTDGLSSVVLKTLRQICNRTAERTTAA